jgi:hypothetical protein
MWTMIARNRRERQLSVVRLVPEETDRDQPARTGIRRRRERAEVGRERQDREGTFSS